MGSLKNTRVHNTKGTNSTGKKYKENVNRKNKSQRGPKTLQSREVTLSLSCAGAERGKT